MKTIFKILSMMIFIFLIVYGGEGSCDSTTKNSPLIGSWLYNPGSLADSAVLTFIDDTNYMFAVDGNPDDGGGRGMERGTYTWDSSTSVFTATSISNTTGDWGISYLNTMTITINGDILNLVDSVEGLIPFTKISSGTNPIICSWLYNPGSLADSAVLTFIDDTNYMFAVDGNPDDGGGRGMERGTYTWDSSTSVFTATSISNTAGDWGISYLNTMTITINGDILNLVDSVEGLIPFTKVSYLIKGDINNDGNIDLEDSILGLKTITSYQNSADTSEDVDVDGDGKIGIDETIYGIQIASDLRQIPIDKIYKIGLSLALTGPTAEIGIIYASGIEDYFKDVNATDILGDDEIDCLISDDQYSLAKTNENFQNFLNEDILFFLGYSTASMLDMKDEFETEKIPVISASLHADNLTDSNYIYLPMASYNEQVIALADYIDRQHQEDTPKIALYVHPSAFGRGPVAALASAASSGLNIEIIETIEHDSNLNITEMLNRLVSENVQYVICQTIQSPVADLLKEAATLGVTAATFGEEGKITFLGAHYTGGADLISLTGPSLQDYYWITSFIGTSQESAARDKQLALAAKYNRSEAMANSYFYANGIAVAQIVTETIKRLKSKGLEVTRDNLKTEIDQMNGENAFHPYTTVGPVTFSGSDHAGVNTLQIYNIQEGVFKTFGEAFITDFSGE